MKLFGCNLPLFVVLLAVVVFQGAYGNHGHRGHHGHGNHGHHKGGHNVVHNKNLAGGTCQPGDYYIISHILAFYVAYSTKYLGYTVETDCPVDVTARETFVHKEGHYYYFWKKCTGTVQVILTQEEVDFLLNNLASYDVPQVFNELVGYSPLTPETVVFADNFQVALRVLLDQRTAQRKFLANFNGAVIYHQIFPPKGIYLDPETSPLCELVNVKTPTEFIQAIEDNSAIVAFLRSVTVNPNVGSNQAGYVVPDHHECWKYVFGHLSLVDTLPEEIQCLFSESGLSKYSGNVDVNALALQSLHVEGVYAYLKEWLQKVWVEYKGHHGH